MNERESRGYIRKRRELRYAKRVFDKEMKANHTILAPQMSPIHFQFLQEAFKKSGYNLVVLPCDDEKAVDAGLKYVNNDACYRHTGGVGRLSRRCSPANIDWNTLGGNQQTEAVSSERIISAF
jgi:hypothetical protein